MNEVLPKEDNALAIITKQNVVQFFAEKGLDPVIEKIKKEVNAFVPDMTTEKGRKDIASFAYRIAKMKTQMDDLGKDLVSGIKQQAKIIDAERGRAWDIIEQLQKDVRKPLTEWEEKDALRVAEHKKHLEELQALIVLPLQPSLEELQRRFDVVNTLKNRDFEEFKVLSDTAISAAITGLTQKIELTKKQAADQAELERLQSAEKERQQKEREERLQKEAADKAKTDAETAARATLEKAAKETADATARADRAEKEKNDAIEKERKRVADEKKAEEDAAAKREANKKHRTKINNEVLEALKKIVDEDTGKAIIEAIVKEKIPHTKITY